MTDQPFRGVLAPVLTPFTADLTPDVSRFTAFCRWLLAQGADGLAVFGTTSEANSQSSDQRMALLDSLIDSGVPGAKLMPGTGACSIDEAVRLNKHAVGHGCGGVRRVLQVLARVRQLLRGQLVVCGRVADRALQVDGPTALFTPGPIDRANDRVGDEAQRRRDGHGGQGGGHGGSHPHLVHEMLSALDAGREPWPNATQSANWTCVGICANESAARGGEKVRLPEFTLE